MTMPLPDTAVTPSVSLPTTSDTTVAKKPSGKLTENEYGYILDTTLKPKNRKDPKMIAFIESFVRCKNIAQASAETGINKKIGFGWRHRVDIARCIQKMIDKSTVKHGFDGSEILERVKEVVDFDPIMMVNPDGTYKNDLNDIEPEARRSLKKLKVKNLWGDAKPDMNGIVNKLIVGEIIEYEFYDKLKAAELVGKEKEMFKNTTKVEHGVTKDMANLLLESAKRADKQITMMNDKNIIDVTPIQESDE